MPAVHPATRRAVLDVQYSPWKPQTLSQHLDRVADNHRDFPFVIGATADHVYTYGDIQDWSRRIAAGLIDLGVKPGEHVAMVMANYPEFVAIKFAISRVGAVCVPINFLLRQRELSYVLSQSDAVVLITMDRLRDNDYLSMLDSTMPGWDSGGTAAELRPSVHPSFPRLRNVVVFSPTGDPAKTRTHQTLVTLAQRATPALLAEVVEREATADASKHSDILYTSGTTGNSKGVLLTHDMLVRTGYASAYARGLAAGHRMVFSMPMYHVFGYIECLLAASFVAGAVVPQVAFDPVAMLTAVAEHQINEIVCIPTMTFALLAEARKHQYDLSSMKIMYSSGGPQPPTIWDEIYDVFGSVEVVAGYGQTETTAAMTSTLPELSDEYLRRTHGKFRIAGVAGDESLGGVLAVYKVIDPLTGADLPRGERGELVVRGPAVTKGYYNKPEETAATIDVNGWLHTGDLGVMDDEDYVTLVGRLKETYRCGGEMVMPIEVEALLVEQAGVAQAYVVGIPHPKMGEVGCAFVVRAQPAPDQLHDHNAAGVAGPSEAELIDVCRTELARFKVPAHVLFIDAADLPLTVTARVQKFKLVELAQQQLKT
jgi:fatty-acyl-CoA synthase